MRRGVGADVARLPIGGRALLIIILQRGAVVARFIAKEFAEAVQMRGVRHEFAPIVMSNLVSQVPEQRAKRFAQGDTPPFTLAIISLGNVDCDYTFVVASHNRRPA